MRDPFKVNCQTIARNATHITVALLGFQENWFGGDPMDYSCVMTEIYPFGKCPAQCNYCDAVVILIVYA